MTKTRFFLRNLPPCLKKHSRRERPQDAPHWKLPIETSEPSKGGSSFQIRTLQNPITDYPTIGELPDEISSPTVKPSEPEITQGGASASLGDEGNADVPKTIEEKYRVGTPSDRVLESAKARLSIPFHIG